MKEEIVVKMKEEILVLVKIEIVIEIKVVTGIEVGDRVLETEDTVLETKEGEETHPDKEWMNLVEFYHKNIIN